MILIVMGIGSLLTLAATPQTSVPTGWVEALSQEVPLDGGGTIRPLCFNLWDGPAPGQEMDAAPEIDDGTGRIRNVTIPGVLVYLPPKEKLTASGGTCVIACMGGAYDHLTRLVGADNTVSVMVHRGIAVVSLKYRLKPASKDPEADAVADGQRAIRFVRAHAAEWSINPQHVGMIGWSAGANLILSLATHMEKDGVGDPQAKDPVERESCRPDFVTLLSPWPNGRQIEAYPPIKAEAGKNDGMPPAFIGSAQDDRTAPFAFAKTIQSGWEGVGGKVEFYEIATGGHGAFELLTGTAKDWMNRWLSWMEKNGMWKKS
jgi:acetyl esterase/lipase